MLILFGPFVEYLIPNWSIHERMTWLVIQTVLRVSGYLVPYRTLACMGLPLPPPFRSILSCASISASRLVFCELFFFFFFLFSSGLSTAAKVHQQQACLSGQPHISLSPPHFSFATFQQSYRLLRSLLLSPKPSVDAYKIQKRF